MLPDFDITLVQVVSHDRGGEDGIEAHPWMRGWIGVARHGGVQLPVAVCITGSEEQLDGLVCEIAARLIDWWFPERIGRVDGIEVPDQDMRRISLRLEHIQNRLDLCHAPSGTRPRAAMDQMGRKEQNN